MNFKKLELIGFKSCAENTSFLIEKGLTGIVGPNGCGKSNIVEALRWCMGETSAKSMRGSGMEDVIFSGTSNRPSKNIAEVNIFLENSKESNLKQFEGVDAINLKRRIEKDKGSRYFINEKEVRARDVQTFFADLSTGAHSPSIISQGKIGALVTAKPTERRNILEEAAGISGIHARRHEAELRLNSAENNLKRADDLKRQQEKRLEGLKKQAEEASKYKFITDEMKQIEAGLYYLKLHSINYDVKITQELVDDGDKEINSVNLEMNSKNQLIQNENEKLKPLRDEKLEIMSKIQRINLELENVEKQEKEIEDKKQKILKTKSTIESDLEREKKIVFDAKSNENRLNEEKENLIKTEKEYYEVEKRSDSDLIIATKDLKKSQEDLEKLSRETTYGQMEKYIEFLNSIKEKIKILENDVKNNNFDSVQKLAEETINLIQNKIEFFNSENQKEEVSKKMNVATEDLKKFQETYAKKFSKNESIKEGSIKRNERIKNIENEVENWRKLRANSENMTINLEDRYKKAEEELAEIENLPSKLSVEKGKAMQNITNTNEELKKITDTLSNAEVEFNNLSKEMKILQEKMMVSREKKARSKATVEGLEQRKKDLIQIVHNELNVKEEALLGISDLKDVEELPDTLEQEEKLDKKKRQRESLGSVNLKADEETEIFKKDIDKMEKDREDLVNAIMKLRASINELDQKGRKRMIEAFEIVNKKFNEVYTKLFNGGSAKLELVDSDDPLEAGLDLLVSPPGKRLQSITLLSGGEQALTALSLIFAVFLTSPAPICILDEVDAPLDDANVTRFCNLLEELTKITNTRFIIVTHHALTMSKMNRLYGVTMPEKGVSQLVAVDLQKAEELVA
jgi:chromosome segregation protein